MNIINLSLNLNVNHTVVVLKCTTYKSNLGILRRHIKIRLKNVKNILLIFLKPYLHVVKNYINSAFTLLVLLLQTDLHKILLTQTFERLNRYLNQNLI